MAGLATAARFAAFADVTLFERQSYQTMFERQSYQTTRVNCGEAISEASVVPLDKTAVNGFLNRIEGFDVPVFWSPDQSVTDPPLARPFLHQRRSNRGATSPQASSSSQERLGSQMCWPTRSLSMRPDYCSVESSPSSGSPQ